ncbi:MAG: DUF3035 domain-containing protein [Kiloniellales bacterium]
MRGRAVLRLGMVIGALLALTACGQMEGIKKQLGMTKQAPDEFRVVSRAPLSLPPEFTLRPPAPGAVRPQEGSATDRARQAIFRIDQPESKSDVFDRTFQVDGRSLGEVSLLKAAGADKIDPDIRLVVNRETNQINAGSDGFVETLIFWRDKEMPGTIIDASAEARRLRENAALGKNVTSGETPTIERRKKGLFEGLF